MKCFCQELLLGAIIVSCASRTYLQQRCCICRLTENSPFPPQKNAGVQNGCSVSNPKGSNGGGRARGGRRNGATSSPPARNNPHPNNKVNNAKNNVAANGSLNTKNDVLFKPTPLRNNGVVAAAVPPNAVESPSTPLTVATLFAAVSGGRASVSPLPAEGKDVCNGGSGGGGGGREVLQELLSNPANLLEHVERMQRNEGERTANARGEVWDGSSVRLAIDPFQKLVERHWRSLTLGREASYWI